MSPMLAPQTTTISRPASSAIPFSPAGDISREEPIAKRSPAIRNVSPAWARSRNPGIRWRKAPAFHRSSRVARLSETQSSAGVIWSVSMASSFFPGRLGSQKMRARPRMVFMTESVLRRAAAALPEAAHGVELAEHLDEARRVRLAVGGELNAVHPGHAASGSREDFFPRVATPGRDVEQVHRRGHHPALIHPEGGPILSPLSGPLVGQ